MTNPDDGALPEVDPLRNQPPHQRPQLRSLVRHARELLKRHWSMRVSAARLRRIDGRPIGDLDGKLLLFAMARNESLRLPYFLDHYLACGVDRIFLIDNGSDDDSVEIALARPNVHVFRTTESFRNYSNWMELLLERYGRGRWCIAADLDEIFFYPHAETVPLKSLCDHLDRSGHSAVQCLLLDMYSDQPIGRNGYRPGQDPLSVCRYFDPEFTEAPKRWINQKTRRPFVCARFSGNLRQRLFGADVNLSKVPLFRYGRGVFAARGMHAMDGVDFAPVRGVVLHFKYLQDFNARVVEEAARGQHEGNAVDYRKYAARVQQEEDLNCFSESSVALQDSAQLVRLGMMRSSPEFDAFAGHAAPSVADAGRRNG